MEVVLIAILLAVKLVVYSGWCWLGLRVLGDEPPRWRRAAAHGLLRLVLGLILGWTLVFALGTLAPVSNRLGLSPIPLALLMGLLRFVEWSVVGALLLRRDWTARGLFGGSARHHAWRIGGVVLSFLTDVGAILGIGAAGMVPC